MPPMWAAFLPAKARSVLRGSCFLAARGELTAAAVAASLAHGAREPWESLVFLPPSTPGGSLLFAMFLLKHLSQLREESVLKQKWSTRPPVAIAHGKTARAVNR